MNFHIKCLGKIQIFISLLSKCCPEGKPALYNTVRDIRKYLKESQG